MQGRRLRLLLASLAALAPASLSTVPPAVAGSMDVSRTINVITLQAKTEANENVFMQVQAGLMRFQSVAFTDLDVGPAGGCALDGDDVTCGTASFVVTIVIRSGAGDDNFQARGGDSQDLGANVDADLGTGEDVLLLEPNSGAVVAQGGSGDDFIESGPLADALAGGSGNDAFRAGLGDDEMHGGDGFDAALYNDRTANVVADLDAQRDDGVAVLGEQDLLGDIEDLFGGSGDDILIGDGEINDLNGGRGSDRLEGRGGFDRLEGDDGSGVDAGNDTLITRDGLADSVDCGLGFDTAITDDIDIAFACEDHQSIPDLQPDRDGDGIDKPLDRDDLDASVRPGAFDRPGDGQNCDGRDAVDLDRDRDGFPAGFDCDDGNRSIHPGARERLGNRVDEDCDRIAQAFAAFPTIALLSTRNRALTEVVGLALVDLDGRERVRIACRGTGCGRRLRRVRAPRRADSLILDRHVSGQRLAPGAVLTVMVRRRDGVRKTFRFRMRANAAPRQRVGCRTPRGGRVARCS